MMDSFKALEVISLYRGNALVVATMTANWEWPQVSANPELDFMFSLAMGKASSIGLGLALAQPGRKVMVFDGDGSLLMNLGSLVTIANMAPPNLLHFVIENTIYRISGWQPVPGAGKYSFAAMARGAGYQNVYEFADLESLQTNMANVIHGAGPTFVCLKVLPVIERPPFPYVGPGEVSRFREALQEN